MNLEKIRKEREKCFEWKNIKPLRKLIQELPEIDGVKLELENILGVDGEILKEQKERIYRVALALKPWRKGPFKLFDLFIDSEWQSFLKYNLLAPHFNLENKIVGDIGCNNGYYLFRMLKQKPKKLIGFDPSALYRCQFDFINHFIKSPIVYELLGVEHLSFYEHKFDTLFCLGVLYHRHNPIETLKSLQQALNPNGELFLDTFFISGEDEMVLSPKKTYSKIPNVHFIPTVKALQNWCEKAGFKDFEILTKKKTTKEEQRKTDWIDTQSLEDFLDPNDENLTVEGYEAPQRVYVKLTK